ncbi:NAD(P)H-hydrate epimerase [Dermabacteraceae bacterium P13138]
MKRAYTARQIRDAEAPLLAAGVPLMSRAATALAHHTAAALRRLRGRVPGSSVTLLVGTGNNGGDALYAGAYLRKMGVAVTAIQIFDRLHPEGEAELRRAGGRIQRWSATMRPADVVIDAILGIGIEQAYLRPAAARALAWAQACGAYLIAADIPSGMHPDTGEVPADAVAADLTVTFGGLKRGMLLPPGENYCGEIVVADIGLELPEPNLTRLEAVDVASHWPYPDSSSNKYSRGVVGVIAGSTTYPGAAVLTCQGACRAGAGMVRYLGPREVLRQVLYARPEVVGAQGKVQAWVIGAGLDPQVDDGQHAKARAVLARARVGVVDAGALDLIRPGERYTDNIVLTPHATEAARLASILGHPLSASAVAERPGAVASLLAQMTGATVLLKGATTVIAPGSDPQHLITQADATPFLATAGAGDVLAGVIGTLLAAGVDGPRAAVLGAMLHGTAAKIASRGGIAPIVAEDVARELPAALAALTGEGA